MLGERKLNNGQVSLELSMNIFDHINTDDLVVQIRDHVNQLDLTEIKYAKSEVDHLIHLRTCYVYFY